MSTVPLANPLAALEDALAKVEDPELHRPLMHLGMLKNLRVSGATAHLRVILTTPACPLKDRIQSEIEAAVIGTVPGIDKVELEWDANVSRTRGVIGRQEIPGVRNTIAVSASKGGVGKTTVAVNLALALLRTGARVGLLDADIYGPNVPIMLGLTEHPSAVDGRMVPLQKGELKVVSIGTIIDPDRPVVWRGPMLAGALKQFLFEVNWGELDYLVCDLPPGTGDVQLTLAQSIPLTGAVIVTTPQDVSLADVGRGIAMFQQLRVPILGIIENMSGFVCPHCGEVTDIFSRGGGRELAESRQIPFLGEIPLDPIVRVGGGAGQPLVLARPVSPQANIFEQVASALAGQISQTNFRAADSPEMPLGPRIARS
ncbi:MAG TPA: Mrp/NBP35 family ATP-binding protein [Candidatus Dormibacteraeota bacterium]|nr:Mrp/NBP35 family ATP-binding protein [Candidatus Dormibacteraeota bacterium]